MRKKWFAIVVGVFIVFSLFPIYVFAAEEEDKTGRVAPSPVEILSPTVNEENMDSGWKWEDETDTLYITKNTEDYSTSNTAPWSSKSCLTKKIIIESDVTYIGDYAFYQFNDNLAEVEIQGQNVTIGEGAFRFCSELQKVSFESVTTIGKSAFSGCYALEELNIQNEARTQIGESAFQKSGLKKLTLKNCDIGAYAFAECSVSAQDKTGTLKEIALEKCTIGNSAFSRADFSFSPVLETVVLKNCPTVGNSAFMWNSALISLTVENTEGQRTTFGDYAFMSCSNLKDLTLVNCELGEGLLQYSGLENLTLKNCPKVSEAAFANIKSLKTVSIADCTVIEPYAFQFDTALESVTIQNCDKIESSAFLGCSALSDLRLEGVERIGDDAFADCRALTAVSLNGAKEIGSGAFRNTGLTGEIVIPVSCEVIGGNAFSGCDNITGITIPDTTKMGYSDIFAKFPLLIQRVNQIMEGLFQLNPVEEIVTISPEGWTSSRTGQQNSTQRDGGTQLTKEARWTDDAKTVAEIKIQAYFAAKQQMDFVFVLDASNSMTGVAGGQNATFYDALSKLKDVTQELLENTAYDCRVAIVGFGNTEQAFSSEKFYTSEELESATAYISKIRNFGDNTNFASGFQKALPLVEENQKAGRETTVILLSDGLPYDQPETPEGHYGKAETEQIRALGAAVYGVLHSVDMDGNSEGWQNMRAICDQLYLSSDTAAFSEAVNSAIDYSFSGYVLTDTIHPNFKAKEHTIVSSAGQVSVDTRENGDTVLTWDLSQADPFTVYTLTFQEELQKQNGSYPTGDLDTNLGNAVLKKEESTKEIVVNEVVTPVLPRPGSSSGGSGGNKPSLNTEDHYGYIVGYPVDYETGEPTDDQARKPVKPQGKITRAEVATIFFRMLTDESRNAYWSQSNSFTDVAEDAWYNNAISTMANAGILDGYEDGSFHPNGYITRAEFATIAVRFFDLSYQGEDLFPDIDGHWAQDYINQAADAGIIEGYPDGTFGPQKQITRAEAVTMVNRTLDRHPDPDHFLEDMLVWPDNLDTEAWYYADMQEATNSHEYQMKKDAQGNEYEVWTKILPIRDWEALEKAWSDANSSENPGDVV